MARHAASRAWRGKQLMEFLHEMLLDGPADAEVLLTGNPVIEYERCLSNEAQRHLSHLEIVLLC